MKIRNLYFDRPNHIIRGLQFRASFLSDAYNHILPIYKIYESNTSVMENCTQEQIDSYNENITNIMIEMENAILEKRLDQESVDRYTVLEELYKTVENF